MALIGETSTTLALRDPDIRLMLRVRDQNDNAAFAELVEQYHPRLVAIMHHLVGNADEAEDLAQEIFLRIYRGRKKYRAKAKFSTWLFTIGNNLALNALRRRQRKPVVQLVTSDSGPLGSRPQENLVLDESHRPESRIEQQELAAVIQEALTMLNDRQRLALILNKFEDMNYTEIGEIMGLSAKAIKSLLSRARDNLRIALKDYIHTD